MAVQPKCSICDLELAGGYQEIIHADVDKLDIPQEQKDELKKLPEQKEYFAHDPKNLHVDVRVYAHLECFNKVKAVVKYKDFDKPTQVDWEKPIYPKVVDGVVKELTAI